VTQAPERNEIAVIEWRRITSIAWPTLSVIFAIQALLSQSPIQRWQILYVTGLIIAALTSWALSKNHSFTFSSSPTAIYLLISPLFLGNLPENPWMSIGLAAFAAVIYYSTIESLPLAFVVITLLTVYQTYIAHRNFRSITDNLDISYFHSYFSVIWIFIMGISSVFIRRRYLDVARSIQETVDDEINSSVSRLKSLKQINEKDSRNLRLHGTVLNTLIHLRNLIEQNAEVGNSKQTLIDEVKTLASESINIDNRNFITKLEALISNRALHRIEVSISPITGEFDSPLVEESCLEIIRELILNSEKHTHATTAALTISNKGGNSIRITLIDNSINGLPMKEKRLLLEKTKDSRTLQNLIKACGASIETSLSKGKKYRKVVIQVPYIDLELELKSTLARSRVTGLNDFSLNYVRASALVALLSLPGYLIAGLKPMPLLFTATTVLGFFLVLRFPQSKSLLSLLLLTSLLVIPSISQNLVTCSELSAIPWLFNHILTVGFFASIQFRNRVLRWVPILILSAESIYFPLSYPTECQNIFLGSLPGIPLIIVLALSVLAVRKREVYFDEGESLEIARLARVLTASDNYRERAYTKLLQELSIFTEQLERDSETALKLEVLSLQIQKIQTFLVSAEHFDSELIRKIFELFRESQMQNIPGRLILLGENFANIDIEHSVDHIVRRLREVKADSDANLTIVNVHTLEFHFEGEKVAEKPDSIDGIPVFYGD
jgi:signal transduction histidine kinase